MTVPAELRTVLDELAVKGRPGRVPGWSGRVAIVVAGAPWVTCSVNATGVTVTEGRAADATVFSVAAVPTLRRWLVDGVDHTHLLQSGAARIEGVSFDVLLLSKALGLRPDRTRIEARG